MLARLRKHAATSSALRQASLEKTALVGAIAAGGKMLGRAAMKHPVAALGVGLTAAAAPGAAVGTYRKSMAGFDPGVQRMLSGTPPVPPGTT